MEEGCFEPVVHIDANLTDNGGDLNRDEIEGDMESNRGHAMVSPSFSERNLFLNEKRSSIAPLQSSVFF